MKLHIISPDANGKICGVTKHCILDRLPITPHNTVADAAVIPINFFPEFRFNEALRDIRKPIIVVDYMELGWDYWHKPGRQSHIFGDGRVPEYLDSNPEWKKLDQFLRDVPPALTLKRELLTEDVTPRIRPIEFTCNHPVAPAESRSRWETRGIDVFNCWGYSHPIRPKLHGEIFQAMGSHGINVISDWSQFVNMPVQPGNTWVSIYSPWWVRQPMDHVLQVQGQSKISVSLPGAGGKCFRSAESPIDCIMAMTFRTMNMAWSFPWVHGVNAIGLNEQNMLNDLISATNQDLYDIYVQSQENIRNYQTDTYVHGYVIPTIKECL